MSIHRYRYRGLSRFLIPDFMCVHRYCLKSTLLSLLLFEEHYCLKNMIVYSIHICGAYFLVNRKWVYCIGFFVLSFLLSINIESFRVILSG